MMGRFMFAARSASGVFLLCAALAVFASAAEPKVRTWQIDGVAREAQVYVPDGADKKAAPLVFVWHGHGGTAQAMVRRYQLEKIWPEAIVVYPQGLNTPGRLTDPEGKRPGWQHSAGQLDDRDLKFFDAMLADLKKEAQVDEARIYSTGHSNGGGFTYLLWAERGDVFAAVAPTAAAFSPEIGAKHKPKPVLHLAGENDRLVKYEWQQAVIEHLKKLNQCGEGKPWEPGCTLYESKLGMPVVAYIHPGAHGFPAGAEKTIVKFFQEQTKKSP
ncbi:MAG: dienelactone hydrolase family protein [Pirellulales bacterium]